MSVLAQQGSSSASGDIIVVVGLLIGVLIFGGAILIAWRKRMLGEEQSKADAGSMLETLRREAEAGRMSAEEYEAARRAIIGGVSGASGASPGGAPARPGPVKSEGNSRVAEPGFDLTGEPLPRPPPENDG